MVELKLFQDMKRDQPLTHGCLQPNKGFGRLSMLWFGVLWTWKKLSHDMNSAQISDFQRQGCFFIKSVVL